MVLYIITNTYLHLNITIIAIVIQTANTHTVANDATGTAIVLASPSLWTFLIESVVSEETVVVTTAVFIVLLIVVDVSAVVVVK